ncbi:hypothetical protein B0H13DRAFT_2498719 [Mycena leptocephala]|nr:hypothetical protein B0H13DRAFT_2498719 [Mycena leptocephala]
MTPGLTAKKRVSLNDKLIRFWLLSIFFVTIVSIIFIVAVSHLILKPLNEVGPPSESISSEEVSSLAFAVEIASADPLARTLILDWFPVLPDGCNNAPSLIADIFINDGYLDSTSPTFKAVPPYPPVYQYNSTANGLENRWHEPSGHTSQRKHEIQLATLSITTQEDILLLALQDRSELQCMIIVSDISQSLIHSRNFDIDLIYSPITAGHGRLPRLPNILFVLKIRRSMATKIFVVAVAATDWLLATAFIIISASTAIFHEHRLYTELFVLPVGAVFALTSVRANFPGAPVGFDLYSILPALVIMACCSNPGMTTGSLRLPPITSQMDPSSALAHSMAGDETADSLLAAYAMSGQSMKGSAVDLVADSTSQSTHKP